MSETEEFTLTDEDWYAIEIAKNVARLFLRRPNITPRQIISLGKALNALEQLPLVTSGASFEFGIVYQTGTEDHGETRYVDFRISESEFEISKGGSVYNEAVGGDTFSEPGWLVEVGGYRRTECELFGIEDSIAEYLNLGAKIIVTDETEIEEAQKNLYHKLTSSLNYRPQVVKRLRENLKKALPQNQSVEIRISSQDKEREREKRKEDGPEPFSGVKYDLDAEFNKWLTETIKESKPSTEAQKQPREPQIINLAFEVRKVKIKDLLKIILISAAIGTGMTFGIYLLFGFMNEVYDKLNFLLFLWEKKRGIISLYLLIGSVVSIIILGYLIKEYLYPEFEKMVDSRENPLTMMIAFGVGLFFLFFFFLFGIALWPILLSLMIYNSYMGLKYPDIQKVNHADKT